MFWSIAPLVAACIVLAGILGMCSFAPSGPGPGPAPDTTPLPHCRPTPTRFASPSGYRCCPRGGSPIPVVAAGIDAGRTDPSGQPARAVSSTVGYLAPSGMYLALTQSNADEEKLVGSIDPDLVPTGTQDVDGVRWVVYEGDDGAEPVWTTRLNGPTGAAQIAIKGAAGTDEYRTLAAAVQKQPPLPAK